MYVNDTLPEVLRQKVSRGFFALFSMLPKTVCAFRAVFFLRTPSTPVLQYYCWYYLPVACGTHGIVVLLQQQNFNC